MSADGNWKITINTPMGARTVDATIKTNGETFTGSTASEMGSQDITGNSLSVSGTVRQALPWYGSDYAVTWSGSRGTQDGGISSFNPRLGSRLRFDFTQPLLRDFRHDLRGHDTLLVPWFQDFSLGRTYSLEDVRAQILAARDADAAGFLLWNPSGVYKTPALRQP